MSCRQCGRARPPGYSVTCGRSECQEADYRASARPKKNRRAPLDAGGAGPHTIQTMTAATDKPPTAEQLDTLRVILTCQTANGGSTRLEETDPRTLIKRGWVQRHGGRGSRHMPTRYSLTPAGLELARNAEAAREEARRIRAANRGHNVAL